MYARSRGLTAGEAAGRLVQKRTGRVVIVSAGKCVITEVIKPHALNLKMHPGLAVNVFQHRLARWANSYEEETMKPALLSLVMCTGLSACGAGNSPSPVTAPGRAETAKTSTLEVGAAALQDRPPIEAINAYLDGFHFYSGKLAEQMEAHHYCSILNEEVIQCVIYDGNVKDAKLMGVEYIVSEKLFNSLPAQEKKLWHSHVHEVKSGQLVAPGIPEVAEHALMEKLVHTYGKTWHTWHTDRDKSLPLGVPQLMMGFTADGQVNPDMVAGRDRRIGVSSEKKRQDRQDIPSPDIAPGADDWQNNEPVQIHDPTDASHHSTR